jgi:hypothetical protein
MWTFEKPYPAPGRDVFVIDGPVDRSLPVAALKSGVGRGL